LAIGDRNFTDSPDLPGHELIGPSANEWHRFKIAHSIAYHQVSVRAIDRINKCWDIRGIMLAVPVQEKVESGLN
jgi:hypothetical protein